MIRRLYLFSALLLAGCAGTGQQVETTAPPEIAIPEELLTNELFAESRDSNPILIDDFLELPAVYRQQLDEQVLIHEYEGDRFDALLDWAFESIEEGYEYDPTVTAPLSELETSDRINCFSFSNLFVAAARYSGIDARFQLVDSPPQWDMHNDTWLTTQHINVSGKAYQNYAPQPGIILQLNAQEQGTRILHRPKRNTYVADLNPEIARDAYRSRDITDSQALSLFYSNRSVEKLVSGDQEEATRLGLLAARVDPESSVAWNNLGVLFSRAGKLEEAKESYLAALRLDPNSASSANNLERIYRRLGEDDKAEAMAQQIAIYRKRNPYYHYAMGATKLEYGYLEDALEHFEDAIDRKDNERLFYYRLAETQMKLGKYRRASRSLETARMYSDSTDLWRYDQLYSDLQAARKDS